MAEYSIGVDIGGTNLRAAAVAADGVMLDKISGPLIFMRVATLSSRTSSTLSIS